MKDDPNVILIVLDTLRKDVLPVYNGEAVTPCLEDFAKDAVIFPNAIAPASWTVPSHTSMFSGLYSVEHEVDQFQDLSQDLRRASVDKILNKISTFDKMTIIQRLRRIGYNTVGISSNPYISPGTGLSKDFVTITYEDSLLSEEESFLYKEAKNYGNSKFEKVLKLALEGDISLLSSYFRLYIKSKKSGLSGTKRSGAIVDTVINSSIRNPFFLFLNFMDVHEPLTHWETSRDILGLNRNAILNGNEFPRRKAHSIRKQYLSAVSHLDFNLGRLFTSLREKKIYDNSLIIVTSDHGQALFDNKYGYYGHGIFLFNELIEVPLIVKLPENKKISIKDGYQSLTNISKFIVDVIDGNRDQDSITEMSAFSEAKGLENDNGSLSNINNGNREPLNEKVLEIFGSRKAIYKDGYKCVVNGRNGNVEEFTSNGKEVGFDIAHQKDLLNELLDFSRKAKDEFVINL
jgi:arylsulfatase A-like enzyme